MLIGNPAPTYSMRGRITKKPVYLENVIEMFCKAVTIICNIVSGVLHSADIDMLLRIRVLSLLVILLRGKQGQWFFKVRIQIQNATTN